MIRWTTVILFFAFSSLAGSLPAEEAGPSYEGDSLERILDPMPEFDPFEYVIASPEYFPDEIHRRARQTLIDALLGRDDRLPEHVEFFRAKDKELERARGTVSGLSDPVTDIYLETIEDREKYLDEQRKALATANSERQKRLIQARLRNDELELADALIQQSQMSRWGALLNRLLGSMDLVSIAAGSYIGAAVDTAITEVVRAQSPHMPLAERKALVLYRQYLKRFPDDPKRQEILEKIAALQEQRRKLRIHDYVDKAERALDEQDLAGAEVETKLAELVDPESDAVKERATRLETLRSERENEIHNIRSVAANNTLSRMSPKQIRDVRLLLYALARRDAVRIEEQASNMSRKYPNTPLADLAADAHAVALEIKGQHDDAKKDLKKIVQSAGSERERKRARTLLASPEYNRLAAFDEARSDHRLKTVQFVLLGEDFLEKNLLMAAGPLISHGVAGASSFGAANVLMMGSNLLQVLGSNPISDQAVIDAGAEFVRNHPDSSAAANVYNVLAEAYEDKGRFDKAIYYYEMAGAPAEKIAELQDEAANMLLKRAEDTRSKATKKSLFLTILKHFPGTGAARSAEGRLARLMKYENRGFRISKRFLAENPELYGPSGLGLKATLFDDRIENMELADKGISLFDQHSLLLHYDTPWGPQTRTYPVTKTKVQRFEAALRAKHYEIAAADVHLRDANTLSGLRNLPRHIMQPSEIRERSDLRLIRQADGAEGLSPRMRDHELLSEEELHPPGYNMPELRGSITTSGVSVSGELPGSLVGDGLMIGNDQNSPYAAIKLPIPMLKGFIPIDFLLQARPGRPSLTPRIRTSGNENISDAYLYR